MTTVFRAYSPTRDDTYGLTADRDVIAGAVEVLNQSAVLGTHPADWRVQQGTIRWENP